MGSPRAKDRPDLGLLDLNAAYKASVVSSRFDSPERSTEAVSGLMEFEIFHKYSKPLRQGQRLEFYGSLAPDSSFPLVSIKSNDSLAKASQSQCAKASPQTRLPPLRACQQVETWSLNDRNDQNMQREKRSIIKYTF